MLNAPTEVWRGMPGQKSVPSFENGKCVFEVPVDIEDFINQFSVTYGKGSFILKGSFQGRSNYYLRTSVGTDMGYCASINPVVSVEPNQDLCMYLFPRSLPDRLQPTGRAKHGDT